VVVIVRAAWLFAVLLGMTSNVRAQSTETVFLSPYLDVVILDVVDSRNPMGIDIFPPGADHPVAAGSNGVEEIHSGGLLTTLILRRPAPGYWRFRKSRPEGRIVILAQRFFPRGRLFLEDTSDLRQHDRVFIAYRLMDEAGLPLKELARYPLSVDLAVARPDGRREVITMQRDSTFGAAVFRAGKETECDLPGYYWTEVEVRAKAAGQLPVTVFRDQWSGYQVRPAALIRCRLACFSLQEAAISSPSAFLTRIDCLDARERPVDLKPLVKGRPADLFRPLLSRDGVPTEAALDLRHAGPGVLEGEVRGAYVAGAYRLHLKVDHSRLRPDYNIRILPDEISFRRRRDFAWIVVVILAAGASVFAWRRKH
jgi:hypothetical protein